MTHVHRVSEFDTWKAKYQSATVRVLIAGTTTLAAVFTDEALTVAAPNPQTLTTFTDGDGTVYGKFLVPIYTASAYELEIDSIDQTGIERPPVHTLIGEDASKATVIVPGETTTNELEDIVARVTHLENHGVLSATDGAANKAIIDDAVGAVAGQGGGTVIAPAGTFPFTSLTIPQDVVIEGQGRTVTVLESQTQGDVVTFGGARAGLRALTLDGVDLQTGSVGVLSKKRDETVFDNVEIKRFETGLICRGARDSNWRDFFISNCVSGALLFGDLDGGAGDQFRHNRWVRGKVDLCTTVGVDLSYEDAECAHNFLSGIDFEDNIGIALRINGARYTELPDVNMSGNTTDLVVQDDDAVVTGDPNKVIGLTLDGGEIDGGTVTFTGLCQDIILDRMQLSNVSINLTLPGNNILIRDSIEAATVTIAGDGTKIVRVRSILDGASAGLTTSASVTKAWSLVLEPGQVGHCIGEGFANRRDGEENAHYHRIAKFHRPGSTLAYDSQTVNYTVGQILTGTISGATARIVADADGGATGTLTLRAIAGIFQNNELITDALGGSADANGILVPQDVVIDLAENVTTAIEDVAGLDASFAVNGGEIEFQVTGIAAQTYEWLTRVRATVT